MNKISIITFFRANNYGAVLQCYCLQEYLKSIGYNVTLLNAPSEEKSLSFRAKFREKLVSIPFIKFRNKFLSDIDPLPNSDIYVFGSDQIWNIDITRDNALFYFGSTIPPHATKIAYAASFGVSHWENNSDISSSVRNLLSRFKSIGVRESSGLEICKNVFNVDSEQVLDPTFLLKSLPNLVKNKNLNKVMTCYLFNKEKEEISNIRYIANKLKLKTYILNDVRFRKDIKSIPYPSVSNWLSTIYSSDLIITDSFHCMVFAIKAKKNFFAIPAIKARSGRMTSLLKSLGLSHRYFDSLDDILISDELEKSIFYNEVEIKLNYLENKSKYFIENSLKS